LTSPKYDADLEWWNSQEPEPYHIMNTAQAAKPTGDEIDDGLAKRQGIVYRGGSAGVDPVVPVPENLSAPTRIGLG
jgi:hypothetical protein